MPTLRLQRVTSCADRRPRRQGLEQWEPPCPEGARSSLPPAGLGLQGPAAPRPRGPHGPSPPQAAAPSSLLQAPRAAQGPLGTRPPRGHRPLPASHTQPGPQASGRKQRRGDPPKCDVLTGAGASAPWRRPVGSAGNRGRRPSWRPRGSVSPAAWDPRGRETPPHTTHSSSPRAPRTPRPGRQTHQHDALHFRGHNRRLLLHVPLSLQRLRPWKSH